MLVIVILNWNVCDLLRACLRSIEQYPATSHAQRIVVVDNASTDGSMEMLQREFPEVTRVANTINRGFSGGNNDGIHAAETLFAQDIAPTDYVLLLNPDTEVMPGALDTLLAYADAHPDAGIIGPQLLYANGQIQSSRRRFPTLATALFESTWLQPYAPRKLLDAYYMRDRPDGEVCDVDWVYGAVMLVRRATYRQCGLLDENTFFMYSEEVDWCRRIKTTAMPGGAGHCWRITCVPQGRVVHHEGQSSAQASARRMIHFNTSKVRYFRKHHGRGQALALRIALLGMFIYQVLLESAKWLAGHRRDLRASRIRAYAAVLRSGLK